MGYFKNTAVWGHYAPPPPNFVVSSSIMIKFGVLVEFDNFSPKKTKNFKNDVTAELWHHLLPHATLSFEISKFFISERIWLNFGSEDKF